MLVLSRMKGEVLLFGTGEDRIEVRVVDVRGGKVRLGINAPDKVVVMRAEKVEEVARENRDAAEAAVAVLRNASESDQSRTPAAR